MPEKLMNRAVFWLELVMAALLIAITALTVAGVVLEVVNNVIANAATLEAISREDFTKIISHVLEVFIVIELFRIAMAYMRHENVIPTVLEAALVAVARKFVVYEPVGDSYLPALGLSALIISVSVSWWLLNRSRACEVRTNTES